MCFLFLSFRGEIYKKGRASLLAVAVSRGSGVIGDEKRSEDDDSFLLRKRLVLVLPVLYPESYLDIRTTWEMRTYCI